MKRFRDLTLHFKSVEDKVRFLAEYDGHGDWVHQTSNALHCYVNDTAGVVLSFLNLETPALEVGNITKLWGLTPTGFSLKMEEYNALLVSFAKGLEDAEAEFGFQVRMTPDVLILSEESAFKFGALVSSLKSESYDKGTLFDFGVSVSVNDFLTSEDLADGLVAEGISDWQVDSVIQQYETCMDFIDWEEERRDASDRNFLDQQTGLSFLVNLEQS